MKLITFLSKHFGQDNINDWSDVRDDSTVLMYLVIWWNTNSNDCEPDYFLDIKKDGSYRLRDLCSTVLYQGHDEKALRTILKTLQKNS